MQASRTVVRLGFVSWGWSALCALLVGLLEALVLLIIGFSGQVEFALLGIQFVAIATAIAFPAIALLIVIWLLLTWLIPTLVNYRVWLLVYVIVVSFPLYLAPISLYEFALAAPTLLGFLTPRYVVRKLTNVSTWAS